MSSHEKTSQSDEVKIGSNRAFGLVFVVVFLVIALWPLLNDEPVRNWSLWIAGALLLVSLVRPQLLTPLNQLWFKFGLLLHKIVSPVVMALLYFLTVTPTALLMRLFGKRPLDLEFDETAETYWIERTPRGPSPETMKNQF